MTVPTNEVIGLTGNPFVDTGLAVIASLAGRDNVEELTLTDVRRVHGDGTKLTRINGKLDNFTMVFTKNSLLTNPSIRNDDRRSEMYRSVVNAFLDSFGREELPFHCEACGGERTLDFDRLCRFSLAGITAEEQARFVGRDWFPLAGSIGSDAQALPAASRPVRLCAKCLFSVHYLPQGLILLDGQLAAFQSTAVPFWYELVRYIATEVESRIHAANYANIGAKEGSGAVVDRLLGLFGSLQEAKRFADIPPAAALEAWRFTNSNPPDCDIMEVPNEALRFLWEAVGWGLRFEIVALIRREGKSGSHFLSCVLEQRDYDGLYPHGSNAGASPKLFALYQYRVCGRSSRVLALAHTLANQRACDLNSKELERLKRREAFWDLSERTQFRAMMVRLAANGKFNLGDYLGLFPIVADEPGIRVAHDGWKLIRYCLHHLDDFEILAGEPPPRLRASEKDAMVRHFAALIMREYVTERGWDRFRSDVLNRMARGGIGLGWLQEQFVRLAESHRGFTYTDWKDLCTDGKRRSSANEMLFQMRLLWADWANNDEFPQMSSVESKNGAGLPNEVGDKLRQIMLRYIKERGRDRFRREVLTRFRRRDIGLAWLGGRLIRRDARYLDWKPLPESQWEQFLRDEEGRPCPAEKLFQVQLAMANLYREFCEGERKEQDEH